MNRIGMTLLFMSLAACGGARRTAAVPSARPAATATTATTSASSKSHRAAEVCAEAPLVEVKLSAQDAIAATSREHDSLPSPQRPARSLKSKGDAGLGELQALDRKAAWEEVLERADDVGLAQRSAAWERLVEHAATSLLRDWSATSSFDPIFRSQALFKRYPHLAQSKALAAERARVVPQAAESCLEESYRGRRCVDAIKEWLRAPGTPSEVALTPGKIVRAHQNAYVAAPIFKAALERTHGGGSAAQMCSDEDLRTATAAALALPDEYDEAASARTIAAGPCWDTMKDGLRAALEADDKKYFRDNVCAVMKAKGAL